MELSRDDGILLTCNNVYFDRIAVVELCIFPVVGLEPGVFTRIPHPKPRRC